MNPNGARNQFLVKKLFEICADFYNINWKKLSSAFGAFCVFCAIFVIFVFCVSYDLSSGNRVEIRKMRQIDKSGRAWVS